MGAEANHVLGNIRRGGQGLAEFGYRLAVQGDDRAVKAVVAKNAEEMLGERLVHLASPVAGNPGWAALEENNSNL